MQMTLIDYHADDYGLSVSNARVMLDCIKEKRLDSISIIPTMDCFEECMCLLRQEWDGLETKPLITVHIDLIDGKSLSVKPLTLIRDDKGNNSSSWGSLFICSLVPGARRRRTKEELTEEIYAQIKAVYEALPEGCELRLDSHMHTHMIPVVREAMFDAVDKYSVEKGITLSFVRVAREPIVPFISTLSLIATYSPVNFAKNFILNILAKGMERELDKRGVSYGLLWGLIMSGHMDKNRCEALFDKMYRYADKKHKSMEILYHPGKIHSDEVTAAHCKDDVTAFYISDERDIELDAVMNAKRP